MIDKRLSCILLTLFVSLSVYSDDFETHSVKDGENLYRISRKYDVPVNELCRINKISDKNPLKLGMVLKIPAKAPDIITYRVQEGDNLFRIGLKYNITVDKLCKLNGFNENVKLYKGMPVKVPDNDEKIVSSAPVKNNGQKTAVSSYKDNTEKNTNDCKLHIMKSGETLYSIAKLYNIKVKEIQDLNHITDSTILKPGERLKIPADSNYPVKLTSGRNYIQLPLPVEGKIVPYIRSHYRGIIIYNKKDPAVKAINDGVVSHIDLRAGYGLIVFIKHNDGLVSTYSGFSEIYVKKGMNVKKMEHIGKTGTILKGSDPGILFSLQKGSKTLNFDISGRKFYIK